MGLAHSSVNEQSDSEDEKDQMDVSFDLAGYASSDDDDEIDHSIDELLEEQQHLIEQLYRIRRELGVYMVGQNETVDRIFHRLDHIAIAMQIILDGYRLPAVPLRRMTWAEYRKEKIDANLFHPMFRMSPEQFDELFTLVGPKLQRNPIKYVHVIFGFTDLFSLMFLLLSETPPETCQFHQSNVWRSLLGSWPVVKFWI